MAVPGDVVLTQALSRYGKLVSSIKKLAAFPLTENMLCLLDVPLHGCKQQR